MLCRPCFLEEDKRSEAGELEFGAWYWRDLLGWPEGSFETLERPFRDVREVSPAAPSWAAGLVGQQFGEFIVEDIAIRRLTSRSRPSGRIETVAICRCSCGELVEMTPARIRRDRHKLERCRACANREIAQYRGGRARLRVIEGMTVAQISAATGLNRDTIHTRILRGWSLERILATKARPRRVAA